MTESPLQIDHLPPQNLQLMQAYALRAKTARTASDEFDGWLDRICTLPGLTTECLVRLHGQLIAQGFLKFEITGRSVGLRYQISPRGKQAMELATRLQTDGDSTSSDESKDAA